MFYRQQFKQTQTFVFYYNFSLHFKIFLQGDQSFYLRIFHHVGFQWITKRSMKQKSSSVQFDLPISGFQSSVLPQLFSTLNANLSNYKIFECSMLN